MDQETLISMNIYGMVYNTDISEWWIGRGFEYNEELRILKND
jgi:hypothetical protein